MGAKNDIAGQAVMADAMRDEVSALKMQLSSLEANRAEVGVIA